MKCHLNIGSTTSYLDVPAPSFESATIAGYLLVDRNPMGFWKFQRHRARAVALRHVRYLD